MSNNVRLWYLTMCKNKNIKFSAKGLIKYWKEYWIILDDKRVDRIKSIYSNVIINKLEDFDKYPVDTPY